MSEDKPNKHLDDISYVETHQHPDEFVTIIERWEPAKDGECSPLIMRDNETGEYINMKLIERKIISSNNATELNKERRNAKR